jgi:hypothetical protein
MYLPIKVETSSGFLSFMNPKLGELWYDLTLVASQPPVLHKNNFLAEIGKYHD